MCYISHHKSQETYQNVNPKRGRTQKLAEEEVWLLRSERHDKPAIIENTKAQNDETLTTKTEECSQNYRCIDTVVM